MIFDSYCQQCGADTHQRDHAMQHKAWQRQKEQQETYRKAIANKEIIDILRCEVDEEMASCARIAAACGDKLLYRVDQKTMQAYLLFQVIDKLEDMSNDE
jgi:hypothetical protein